MKSKQGLNLLIKSENNNSKMQNRVSIIHLKKKHAQINKERSDNAPNSPKSHNTNKTNPPRQVRSIEWDLSSNFENQKYNDKPLKRESKCQTQWHKDNCPDVSYKIDENYITPVYNKQHVNSNQREYVINDNAELPGIDSLSVIKEVNTTLKVSDLGTYERQNPTQSRIPNESNDLLNDSNISQYFMVNPAIEKTPTDWYVSHKSMKILIIFV